MLSSSVVTGLPHLALHFLLSLSHCSSCQVTFCCCNWSAATWVSRVRTVGSRPSSNQSKPVYSLSCYLLLLWVTRVRTVTSKFVFFSFSFSSLNAIVLAVMIPSFMMTGLLHLGVLGSKLGLRTFGLSGKVSVIQLSWHLVF